MPPVLPDSALAHSISSLPHTLDLQSLLESIPSHAPRSGTGTPTRSVQPVSRTLASLFRRQVTSTANPIIPAFYAGLNTGPTPGTVVGIVFGSVAGFLLILWLIYTCFSFGGGFNARSSVVDEEVVRRRSRSRAASSRVRSPSRSEVIEVSRTRERSRTRTPPRRESRRETVILEETRRTAPRAERDDDVVEVFEETSPVRHGSRKSRVSQSGFRTVDPEAFAGGDRPMRKVGRR